MSVSLQKGQKVSLTKENASLSRIVVGLGWDEAQKKSGGLFGGLKSNPVDCDASALMLKDGKITDKGDIIYFGNLKHKTNTVHHLGDNLTGAGDGDDEQIKVDLAQLSAEYDRIVFVVNIYQAVKRKQDFGMINNAFIRLVDEVTGKELCRYNLSESYPQMTSMIFGEIYRHNDEWKFNALGQGTTDPGIGEVVNRYK